MSEYSPWWATVATSPDGVEADRTSPRAVKPVNASTPTSTVSSPPLPPW
jgi:hypothetical protein